MIFATFRVLTITFFRILTLLIFYFSKKRKPITLRNINLCFPVKNKDDEKRNCEIAKKSFLLLGHSIADFFLLRFYTKKNIDKYVRVKNFDYFLGAIKQNKGLILSGAHFGSCELAAHFFALKGYKNLVLYNPIKKPLWLEHFVKNNRQISGNILIAKQHSLLKICRHLKKMGSVIFLTDQHCMPADGRKVPFFGNKVWTHTMFIKLSLKTGIPIQAGFVFTKNLFEYEIEFFKPLDPKDFLKLPDPEYQMALQSNKILETAIRKSPEQWMWQHRRFKNL